MVLRGAAETRQRPGTHAAPCRAACPRARDAAPSYAYAFNSASWDAFDRWSEAGADQRLGVSTQYLPPECALMRRRWTRRRLALRHVVRIRLVSHRRRRLATVLKRPLGHPSSLWLDLGRRGRLGLADTPLRPLGSLGRSLVLDPRRSWAPAWVSWPTRRYVSWCPLGWNNRAVVQLVSGPGYGLLSVARLDGCSLRTFRTWIRARRPRRLLRSVHGFVTAQAAPRSAATPSPRSSAPIRVARSGAVSRGGSPVYTNLEPGGSRVATGSARTMVGPHAPPRAGARQTVDSAGYARAVPRESSGDERHSRSLRADQRAESGGTVSDIRRPEQWRGRDAACRTPEPRCRGGASPGRRHSGGRRTDSRRPGKPEPADRRGTREHRASTVSAIWCAAPGDSRDNPVPTDACTPGELNNIVARPRHCRRPARCAHPTARQLGRPGPEMRTPARRRRVHAPFRAPNLAPDGPRRRRRRAVARSMPRLPRSPPAAHHQAEATPAPEGGGGRTRGSGFGARSRTRGRGVGAGGWELALDSGPGSVGRRTETSSWKLIAEV